jgi:hypothetical protein
MMDEISVPLNPNYSKPLKSQKHNILKKDISLNLKNKLLNLSKDSPYNSRYQLKILHDYYGVDCKPVGYNKDGIPLLKLKKVDNLN